MGILPACVFHVHAWCPWRSERGDRVPATGVTDGRNSPCGVLGIKFRFPGRAANALAEPSLHTCKYHVIPPGPHTEVWRSHSSWQTPASPFSVVSETGSLNADEVWRKTQQTRESHGLRPMFATCVTVFNEVPQFASVNWSNDHLPSSQDYG